MSRPPGYPPPPPLPPPDEEEEELERREERRKDLRQKHKSKGEPEDRLRELKKLYDKELISEDQYKAKQAEILDEI